MRPIRLAVTALLIAACTPPPGGVDAGNDVLDAGADAGNASIVDETEPNDGASGQEPDVLEVGGTGRGAIDAAGDIDIWSVATEAGRVYRVTATPIDDAPVDLHLTILDAGRDGDAAGQDYVRLARAPDGPTAEIEFIAFGAGGHIVGVRDARDLDGDGVGSAEHRYTLTVLSIARAEVLGVGLSPPQSANGALRHAGALTLHELDLANGADLIADLNPTTDGDFRLYVHSDATGSWIARNDDRALDDADPLIDAPLFEDGPYVLVVENIDETAATLSYAIDVATN